MQALTENARGAALMTAAMAAFVLNDSCMKAVSETMPLYETIALRGVLSVAGLLVLARAAGALRLSFTARDRRILLLRAAAEVAATITFLTALKHMPLANLTAILQSLPLAVTLAAALFLGEAVGWRRMLAILVGFAGVLLIVRPGTAGFDVWALLGLASVGCVVVRDLATRRLSSEVPSSTAAVLSALSVTLVAAAVAPFEGFRWPDGTSLALIAGAAFCLVIGYLTVVAAVRVGDVAMVAPFRYTALVFALFLGWAAFGDLPDAATLAGAGLVVASGLYSLHRERQLRRRLNAGLAA